MRWLLNNVRELNNEDNYYSWKDTFTEILFVVVASRNSSEEICLGAKRRSNLNKLKKMRKVTCICDTIIKGVTFIKGCDYRVDYNPFIGIMIYAPFGYINISKWQLDNYFI